MDHKEIGWDLSSSGKGEVADFFEYNIENSGSIKCG
jgi:hypothetical protein